MPQTFNTLISHICYMLQYGEYERKICHVCPPAVTIKINRRNASSVATIALKNPVTINFIGTGL